jgi:hypothetical protein
MAMIAMAGATPSITFLFMVMVSFFLAIARAVPEPYIKLVLGWRYSRTSKVVAKQNGKK